MSLLKNDQLVENLDWTHILVQTSDIRLLNKLYALYIHIDGKNTQGFTVFVNKDIFEDRLNSYFLGKSYDRNDVLNLEWNMFLTRGYFVKIGEDGHIDKYDQEDKNKYFISFLEVSGNLGTFSSVYKNDLNKKRYGQK